MCMPSKICNYTNEPTIKMFFFFLLIRDEISLKKEEMRIDLWRRRNPPLELNGQLQTINPHP